LIENFVKHHSSKDGLLAICGNILITQKIEIICREFQRSLEERNDSNLAKIYKVVARIPENLVVLKVLLEKYVQYRGMEDIAKLGEDCSAMLYVDTLLKVDTKFQTLISIMTLYNTCH
jgi:cullin 1